MRADDERPGLLEILKAEYKELLGRGYSWPICGRPDYRDDHEDLDTDIQRYLYEHIEFQDGGYYDLLSHWTIATYFTELLTHFPRLVFYAPTRSGKSRALRVLSLLGYRGDSSPNSTGPATFRDIERFRLSTFIDEYQALSRDRRQDMDSVFIAGFDKSGPIKRVGDDGTVQRFWAWGPMAIGYKDGKLREDLENRSVLINMVQRTRNDIVRRVNEEEAFRLRTRLMGLRYRLLSGSITGEVDFEGQFKASWSASEADVSTPAGLVKLDDRTVDMGANLIIGSVVLQSRESDFSEDLRLLAISQTKALDTLRESLEGQTFHALLEIIVKRMGMHALVEEYDVTGISTTDIADQLNEDLREQGNDHFEKVKTIKVTGALREMGFEYRTGGNYNKSFLVQRYDRDGKDTAFYPKLRRYLQKYGSGNIALPSRPEVSEKQP